ncbi:T-cell leukemia translocation-altered gene protein isoform X2 [Chelonia mydas]|uniref:T-cell leukemia translocation-altered gene protein isoform X2 n=1 Tax=Chelonia mydas TaxID=8469 RepID=UPI001CA7C891|nr:T-cell leukemia translocation-altered gene protein isoform X2 [Chelonia mydas]
MRGGAEPHSGAGERGLCGKGRGSGRQAGGRAAGGGAGLQRHRSLSQVHGVLPFKRGGKRYYCSRRLRSAVLFRRLRKVMAAPWLSWEAPGRALRGLAWLGQEFADDWAAQDLRAALFQLLLLWLGLSLLGIHLAWRLHGARVSRLCCRPGTAQAMRP